MIKISLLQCARSVWSRNRRSDPGAAAGGAAGGPQRETLTGRRRHQLRTAGEASDR